ncbi:hypothetical protein C0Q70_16002 [Pomacea canaliculata]|uniref:Uncharacterized protein n=1 Tax=Pomacea canaliculata TaxID=400727 RepID=A0A2T7NNM4_POMCA|nr:hypothetical protein C0Q70_16002 [Pomacea canaliculata]
MTPAEVTSSTVTARSPQTEDLPRAVGRTAHPGIAPPDDPAGRARCAPRLAPSRTPSPARRAGCPGRPAPRRRHPSRKSSPPMPTPPKPKRTCKIPCRRRSPTLHGLSRCIQPKHNNCSHNSSGSQRLVVVVVVVVAVVVVLAAASGGPRAVESSGKKTCAAPPPPPRATDRVPTTANRFAPPARCITTSLPLLTTALSAKEVVRLSQRRYHLYPPTPLTLYPCPPPPLAAPTTTTTSPPV